MRTSILSAKSCELSGLCAACARRAHRPRITAAATATATTARALSTRREPRPLLPLPRAAPTPSRRSLSQTSPAPAPQSRTAAHSSTSPSPPPCPGASSGTFYDLFPQTLSAGPPPAGHFAIDTRALRREFLRLQAATHPDRNPGSPAHAAASARLNEAFRTLTSPLLRAQHLLRTLHGIDLAADEEVARAGRAISPAVLATAMEALGEVEEAQSEADLDGVRGENGRRIDECVAGLEAAFACGDVDRVVELAVRLRYWVNVDEGIMGWERGRGVVLEH